MERSEQDRLEAHGAGFEQHFAERLVLPGPVPNEIDQEDRVAHNDAEHERQRATDRGLLSEEARGRFLATGQSPRK